MQNFMISSRFLDTLSDPILLSRNGALLYYNSAAQTLFSLSASPAQEPPLPAPLADFAEEQVTQIVVDDRPWQLTVQPQENETLYRLTLLSDVQQEAIIKLTHQLRTRLGRLSLAVDGLQSVLGEFLQHQHRSWIAREDLYLAQLQHLVEDAELMSRTNEDLEMMYPPMATELEQIFSEVEPLLISLGEVLGRRFTYRPAFQDFYVNAHPELLRKLLFQLAANSYQANGDVTLYTKKQGSSILIYFSDDGDGIPSSALPTLFSPELRPDAPSTQSPGLGLPLCLRIARLYGGTLTFVPQQKGAKFILSLPLVKKKKDTPCQCQLLHDPETIRLQAITELSDLLPYRALETKYGK